MGLAADLLSPLGFMIGARPGHLFALCRGTHHRLRTAHRLDARPGQHWLSHVHRRLFGYLGYVIVLLWKTFFSVHDNFIEFFVAISWFIAAGCILLLIPCWIYFALLPATKSQAAWRR